jgi:ABC-type branched-subunit amino acid transport system ATPase component
LKQFAASGMTMLIVEHNIPFLRTLATHMICLDQGRVIASGPPHEVYSNQRVLDAYLGESHEDIDVSELTS